MLFPCGVGTFSWYIGIGEGLGASPDARRQVARAGDRFMEVLRLFEEERLGVPLPNWTEYAIALARRRSGAAVSELFGDGEETAADVAVTARLARKSARMPRRVLPTSSARSESR